MFALLFSHVQCAKKKGTKLESESDILMKTAFLVVPTWLLSLSALQIAHKSI